MVRLFPRLWLASLLLAAPLTSSAEGFGINATRLIYPQEESSVSVTLRNTLKHGPYLVQVTVSSKQSKQVAAPFTVTPPLFRLEAQNTNQVRIAYTGVPLPGDRESVFYLNATAIPASAEFDPSKQRNDVQARLNFGISNVIKVFYRPSNLPGTPSDAQKSLQFSRDAGGLKVTNSSPYFVSLKQLKVNGVRLPQDIPPAKMIAPFGSHTWPLKTPLATGNQVLWWTIDDNGGIDAFNAVLP